MHLGGGRRLQDVVRLESHIKTFFKRRLPPFLRRRIVDLSADVYVLREKEWWHINAVVIQGSVHIASVVLRERSRKRQLVYVRGEGASVGPVLQSLQITQLRLKHLVWRNSAEPTLAILFLCAQIMLSWPDLHLCLVR